VCVRLMVQARFATLTESRIAMMDINALEDLMTRFKMLADQADTPAELYLMIMQATAVTEQRAHELKTEHPNGRDFGWAVQVHKDSREASHNAERMFHWITNESE
jgi:hypothetical protein